MGKGTKSVETIISKSRNAEKCLRSSQSSPGIPTEEKSSRQGEEAYNNWIRKKNKEKELKLEAERRKAEMHEKEKAIRKEAAQVSYAIWMEKKKETTKGNFS